MFADPPNSSKDSSNKVFTTSDLSEWSSGSVNVKGVGKSKASYSLHQENVKETQSYDQNGKLQVGLYNQSSDSAVPYSHGDSFQATDDTYPPAESNGVSPYNDDTII